jgi:serine/threonine-protein kinase
VLFYQMVTGTVPFSGTSSVDILVAHLTTRPMAPIKRCPSMDMRTNDIILRCLEKEPDKRFQSMDELREALQAVVPSRSLPQMAPIGDVVFQPLVASEAGEGNAAAAANPTVTSELVERIIGQSLDAAEAHAPAAEPDQAPAAASDPPAVAAPAPAPVSGEGASAASQTAPVEPLPRRVGARRGLAWAAGALLLAGASAVVALRLAGRPTDAHVAPPTVRVGLDSPPARVEGEGAGRRSSAQDGPLLAVQPPAPDAATAPPRKAIARKKRRPPVRAGAAPVEPKKIEPKVEPKVEPKKIEPKVEPKKIEPKKVEPAAKKPAPKKKFQDWVQDPPELR